MPSKLLIAAADTAHTVRDAEAFGLRTTLEIDGGAVLRRVQSERDRFVGFVLRSADEARADGELIEGYARFVGPHLLRVDDHIEVEARTIVIATGSEPVIPPPFRALGDRLLTNETIFELPRLPRSLLVAGAGVIGLELGQAMSRLGVETTLVSIDDAFGPLRDPQCRASAHEALGGELDIFLNYQLEQIERQGDEVALRFRAADGSAHQRTVERVLVAAGRRPRLGELALEQAGVTLERGRVVGWNPRTMQVGETHIFVAGDATDDRPLLHEAADEGRIAGLNAARFPAVLAGHRRTPLAVVFTDPQLAVVGEPFEQMNCDENRAGAIDYAAQGRARVMHQNRGLVRLYGEYCSELLLGAEMVGPRVEHTAHLLAWAIQQRLTISQLLDMPFYHPVVEEGIRTALRSLQTELSVARPPGAECVEFGPGT